MAHLGTHSHYVGQKCHILINKMPAFKRALSTSDKYAVASLVKKRKFSPRGRTPSMALKRAIRDLIPEELKYYLVGTAAGAPVSLTINTASIQELTAVGRGTGDNERIGTRCLPKYLDVRWTIFGQSAQVIPVFRLMVVMDTENNGTAPIGTDILEYGSVVAPTNSVNKGRFKILYDQCQTPSDIGMNTSDHYGHVYIDLEKKLRGNPNTVDRMISFNGDTAASVLTQGKNSCWLLLIADQTITANYGVGDDRAGFEYSSRFAFTDA